LLVFANFEIPEIDPLGLCLIVGFGSGKYEEELKNIKFENEKHYS
jgi:hypothetical protein